MMETHNAFVKSKWTATTTDGWIIAKGSTRKEVEPDAEFQSSRLGETILLKRRERDSNDYEVVREVNP